MMAAGNKQFTNHANGVPYFCILKKMTRADRAPGHTVEHQKQQASILLQGY
jgi:hypothetical protein